MSLCNVFRPGHQKGGFGIEEILLFLLLISASSQYDFGGRDFCPNNVARMLRVGVVFTEDDVEAGRAKAYQVKINSRHSVCILCMYMCTCILSMCKQILCRAK